MKFFRNCVFFGSAVCLLGQTPPPKPVTPVAPASPVKPSGNAPAGAAQPGVTMSVEQPKAAPVVPPDRVVLSCGDVKLTSADFDRIIDALPEQYRASARGPARKSFADNVVRVLVLSQEAKRRKLDESPNYKAASMFQNANLLAAMEFEQLGKDVKIDDATIRKYYDEHKAEFEQVHARHILIRMQGSPVPVKPGQKDLTEAEALAKVEGLRKKVQMGEDFGTLAIAESDDAGSGAKGGDLGFFKKGQMVPSFDEAAFKLQPGELSQPVKSQFGYHLIKVDAHEFKSLDEVKPELERRIRPEMAQKSMEELQKNANVVLDPEFFGTAK